jgi:hypothetical protein
MRLFTRGSGRNISSRRFPTWFSTWPFSYLEAGGGSTQVYKTQQDRAGSTEFVAPDLVHGTLGQGFKALLSLATPFQRAVFMMFLVAEVQRFSDGNGRLSRIMMNAELVSAGDRIEVAAADEFVAEFGKIGFRFRTSSCCTLKRRKNRNTERVIVGKHVGIET